MGCFALYLAGCGDTEFEIEDDRFDDEGQILEHLHKNAPKPNWVRLGQMTVFSQNLIAVEHQPHREENP